MGQDPFAGQPLECLNANIYNDVILLYEYVLSYKAFDLLP